MRILITDGLGQAGVELLRAHPDLQIDLRKSTSPAELLQMIKDYDGIIIRTATKLTAEAFDRATQLKLIVRAGVGVDNIDVPAASSRNIPVMNTALANSLAAAEQTIALMFAVLRFIPQASQSLREGRWDHDLFRGREVSGKTLGVIGVGNIGSLVVEKAVGLGMKVIGYDIKYTSKAQLSGRIATLGEDFSIASSLDEVLRVADVLSVHVPKKQDTLDLISTEQIAIMKDKSYILNCARGGIVSEKAVLCALDSGKLSGAAFDVFEQEPPIDPNPLFSHPRAVCVPHLGGATLEAQERVAITVATQVIGFFTKGERAGIIN